MPVPQLTNRSLPDERTPKNTHPPPAMYPSLHIALTPTQGHSLISKVRWDYLDYTKIPYLFPDKSARIYPALPENLHDLSYNNRFGHRHTEGPIRIRQRLAPVQAPVSDGGQKLSEKSHPTLRFPHKYFLQVRHAFCSALLLDFSYCHPGTIQLWTDSLPSPAGYCRESQGASH